MFLSELVIFRVEEIDFERLDLEGYIRRGSKLDKLFSNRYVDKVMVQDLETGQKWYFLCSAWLAVDMGDFVLDRVFPVASEIDLKRFRWVIDWKWPKQPPNCIHGQIAYKKYN